MSRMIQFSACFVLFGLTLSGCGKSETVLSGPVSQDAIKVAQEEDKRAQDAELAEQQRALQTTQQ